MYRAPGASEWQEVEWDWALDEIANRVKGTRDANWIETEADGRLVRRTEAIASVGLWAWCTSNTRRAYDTPLLLRLWQSRSVEER
jgi:anaerobic selenocysteine-containing dehydrogenase